jgi:hypothetical protein
VPSVLERSRSGNGAHAWIFFESALPASTARKVGCAILTRTMERRHQLGLDSYDRLFPNQDTMPKGGFGNLIALPLQFAPRRSGNSVFVDQGLYPYPDQWEFLSKIRRMSTAAAEEIIADAQRNGDLIGVRISATVLFHWNDSPMAFVASHVFAFSRKTLLNVDLLPPRSVPDLTNLY